MEADVTTEVLGLVETRKQARNRQEIRVRTRRETSSSEPKVARRKRWENQVNGGRLDGDHDEKVVGPAIRKLWRLV